MKYYSLKQVEQNQRFIQKRGQRSLFGESRHITTPNGSMEALCYLDKAKSTDYVYIDTL